jgi:hypothetical protein
MYGGGKLAGHQPHTRRRCRRMRVQALRNPRCLETTAGIDKSAGVQDRRRSGAQEAIGPAAEFRSDY